MQRISNLIKPFLEPGALPVLFIAGVILLNLISNALYDWLAPEFDGPAAILIMFVLIFFALIIINALFRRLVRRGVSVKDINRRRGLIALVSQGRPSTNPALGALRYHLRGELDEHPTPVLEYCWLITSPAPDREPEVRAPAEAGEPSQSAWKNAYWLQEHFRGQLAGDIRILECDSEDPEQVFQQVDQAYRQARKLGLKPKEIVADITGGTKLMTAGMVLACTPADRDVEYLKPRAKLSDGRADPSKGAVPRLIDLEFSLETGLAKE